MLEALLTPETIAVIGASRNPDKVGYKVLANLIDGGFPGTLVPVNPKADEVLGLKCYSDLRDYDGKVDQSIVVIPARFAMDAVESSLAVGARALNIISAGFKELGPEGAALERDLVRVCAGSGARVLGPNCLGLINTGAKMNASFAARMPAPGDIAFITQSGALCAAILDWADANHVGFSKVLTIGNKADISEVDLLQVLGADDETKVIVAYLESITDGAAFIEAASATARKKPIVIFKSGVTHAGTKAASSHTGSLAGADVAYQAAFERAGVVRAHSFEEMFDFALGFAGQPLPRGGRTAIVTNAGGPGIMAADAAELGGLTIPALDHSIAAALAAELPQAASVSNPVDVLGDAGPERYSAAVNAAQDDNGVDAIIVILTPQAVTRATETAEAVIASARGEKPILTVFMGGTDVAAANRLLTVSRFPVFKAPDRAVATLKAMAAHQRWLAAPPREVTRFDVARDRVVEIIRRYRESGLRQIGEPDAKDIFRAYGLRVMPGRFVPTAAAAAAAAEDLGCPLAMKVVSPDVLHKSDVGGVALGLDSAAAVEQAFAAMMARVAAALPDADLQGVYLERMCPPGGREVILGVTRDPQFGPLLMFGLGGIFVEVLKDVVFNIAPLTAAEALDMVRRTRAFALLEGVRGQAGVCLPAICESLQRLSQLAGDFPEIAELDINPFMAGETAADSVAADARITLLPQADMEQV